MWNTTGCSCRQRFVLITVFFIAFPQKCKSRRGGRPDAAGTPRVCLSRGWWGDGKLGACRKTGGGRGRGWWGWQGRRRVRVEGELTREDQTELQWSCDRCTSSQTAPINSGRWVTARPEIMSLAVNQVLLINVFLGARRHSLGFFRLVASEKTA